MAEGGDSDHGDTIGGDHIDPIVGAPIYDENQTNTSLNNYGNMLENPQLDRTTTDYDTQSNFMK